MAVSDFAFAQILVSRPCESGKFQVHSTQPCDPYAHPTIFGAGFRLRFI